MNNQTTVTTQREEVQQKYNNARSNLILMIAFTFINVVLLAVGSDVMMLFSATVPYFAVGIGVISENSVILMIGILIALVILSIYLLCWILSKKNYGWMIAALVLFVLDSICMCALYLLTQDFSGILDVAIHIWVLYYLIIGVKYGAQLKKLPEEEIIYKDETSEVNVVQNDIVEESLVLKRADEDVKCKILLEADKLGHHICYRRVKRVNELVIDGYVYDDIEMIVESAHALNAVIDGHKIQVGYDGGINSYLRIDGETVLKKKRFY